MTSLVFMLAGLLAGPSDLPAPSGQVSVEATPGGEVEIVIPIDAALVATLESGDAVAGDIPPEGRRASQYRLRISHNTHGADESGSMPPGSEQLGELELLIPVDASLLARLSAGSEVVGEIPTAVRDARRYRLQLAQNSSLARSSAGRTAAVGSDAAPIDVAPTTSTFGAGGYKAAGTYAGSSDLPLPGPVRTNTQPPAMIDTPSTATSLLDPPGVTGSSAPYPGIPSTAAANPATVPPPRTNRLAPVVSSATELVSNTVTAAKSWLRLPPPPSEAVSIRPTYQTTPQVTGLLTLPPPPGAYSPVTPAYTPPTQSAPPAHYTHPDNDEPNLVKVPAGPRAPTHDVSTATETTETAREPIVVNHPPPATTSAMAGKLALPGADIHIPSKEDIDLDDAKNTISSNSSPWAVLSFSLLGLFVSIGGNVFLGWIAWDHRGRYLDLLRKMRREKARA